MDPLLRSTDSVERFLSLSRSLRTLITRKDVIHFTLLALILTGGLIATYEMMYRIAKRGWLINESILHLAKGYPV